MIEQVALHSSPMRDALRAHTDAAHTRLHQHSCFVALFEKTLGLEEYRQLMRRMHGFYVPLDRAVERVLAETTADPSGYRYARRSGHLQQDLSDLGFSPQDIRENPHCEQVARLVSPATLGGVLYVIEGATLGGTGIDRAAQKLMDKDDPVGRRYWAWCRAVNKQRWAMTLNYLDHLDRNGVSMSDLTTGACDTFGALADWLAPLDRAAAHSEMRLS